MKQNILFKTLVDILFIFQSVGIIGIIFIMPFGVAKINMMDFPVEDWTWIHWVIVIVSLIGYIIFVVGLYHLRKVARHLLSNKYFDLKVVTHLKKSGNYFVASGIFSFVVFLAVWIVKLTMSHISLYDSDVMLSFFLIMVGLFFIIQSEVILNAKNFKDDSELTI